MAEGQEKAYQELFNKLDGEHEEEEAALGQKIVCKKHLGLSLRALNESIDDNPQESSLVLVWLELISTKILVKPKKNTKH